QMDHECSRLWRTQSRAPKSGKRMEMHMKHVTKLACAIGLAAIVITGMAGMAAARGDDPPGSAFEDRSLRASEGLNPLGRPHFGRSHRGWRRAYAFPPQRAWAHHHRIVHHSR